jgi:hydrogenase-4 component E
MNALLVALVAVLLLPLFLASWRVSVIGLAAQGWLMAWIAYRIHPELTDPALWIALVDLVAVRGIGVPIALWGGTDGGRDARHDVIPPNLLSWTLAVGMVLVAYQFATAVVPDGGHAQTLVGAAASGVLLGLLVLSTQNGPFGQMIGVLRIENAIALFELDSGGEAEPGIRVAQAALFIATLVLFRRYLHTLPAPAPPPAPIREDVA